METILGWISAVHGFAQKNPTVLWTLGIGSGALVVISLALTPLVVRLLPRDYFLKERQHTHIRQHPLAHTCQQAAGLLLLTLGLLMLVLPGQGLLTILASLFVLDFPGKIALLRSLIKRFHLLPVLNRIRSRHGLPPFDWHTNEGNRD